MMWQSISIGLLLISLSVFWIWKHSFFKLFTIQKRTIVFAFLTKIIFGFLLIGVYTCLHKDRSTADVYKFMDDAKVLQEVRKDNSLAFIKLVTGLYDSDNEFDHYLYKTGNWYSHDQNWLQYAQINDYNPFNANRFVTRINAVLWLITDGNIFLHVIIFAFAGFCGLIAYFKLFARYCEAFTSKILFLLLFFLPGILLWCSAPLKDTLIILFSGFFFYYLFHPSAGLLKRLSLCVLLFILMLFCKYYVAFATVPVVIALLFTQIKVLQHKLILARFTLPTALMLILYLVFHFAGYFPDIFQFLVDKRMESLKNAAFSEASSYLFTLPISNVFDYFLAALGAPALTLFRPLFLESGFNLMLIPAVIENWLLLFVLIFTIVFYQSKPHVILHLMWWYVMLLVLIIGFTSPLAGNIVRFKTAVLPAYLGLLMLLGNELKLKHLFQKLKLDGLIHKI